MNLNTIPERQNDRRLMDSLRRTGSKTIAELIEELGVTATAVRQRLNRLMSEGLVCRETQQKKRGRPSHYYRLTEKGVRRSGTNYADLAIALWQEIRSIDDPDLRFGLVGRIAHRLSRLAGRAEEGSPVERMERLSEQLEIRDVPLVVDVSRDKPTLTILACPYPQLAEQDRSVCAMERIMFSDVLGAKVNLTACRLDGANCCTFEPAV